MSRYVILGGFLGSGKTTTMVTLSDCVKEYGGRAAILVNDLGAKNLVDDSYTTAEADCSTGRILGGCICYQTENLMDQLRRFRDIDHADIVFSDIPGCGIGAMDHVYHKLNREYNGEFELCPFVAVVDPERLRAIMPEQADIHLPDEMRFLFDAQLKEAEVIVLNKIDILSKKETDRCLDFLQANYPHAKVFAISARYRIGVKDLLIHLMSHESTLPETDIGYGSTAFMKAEQKLSWYNRQVYLKRAHSFDGNAFSRDFMENVRERLIEAERNVPHLKVWGTTADGQMIKASLIGVDYPIEFDREAGANTEKLRFVINARATCESELLDRIMNTALETVAGQYNLTYQIFFTECFGMMDEGMDE